MKSIFSLLLLGLTYSAFAQLPPACAGGSPATACATACINCNFNGYFGSTAGYPSGIVPNFCGTVENAQWMGFIAGASNAVFTVTPSNCAYGDGLQIALYEDCMGDPVACNKGEMDGGNLPVSMAVQVTPGRNYFLMIDGFAGDQCDFSVSVTPDDAVYEPPLGTVGSITGAAKVCPGATMTYNVTAVFGANAYIWTGPPGAMIDTMPLPITLVGAGANQASITFGNVGGPICVQAANSCSQTPVCTNPFQVEMLDDAYRPSLIADTLAHLTCSGQPAILNVSVQESSGFIFHWTSDSTGNIVSGVNFKKATVDKTGTYTLQVTNNQNGCSAAISIHVGEPDTPRTAALQLKHITCYGDDDGFLEIGAVTGGLEPLRYSIDNHLFSSTTEFRYLKPGPHLLRVQTADECQWDTTITVLEPLEFLINLGDDTELHLGQAVQLWDTLNVNEPDRVKELFISPAEYSDYLCADCPFEPLHSFRYTVTALDSNGCKATDERIVSVTKERYVYVPNAFAPDAENEGNNRFTVFGGEDVAEVAWLRVFDRWGQLVFERQGFSANDAINGWDGRLRGDKLNPAVFVWQAEILFIDGEAEKRTGSVTLLR